MENAEAGPHHGPWAEGMSQSQPRLKVVPVHALDKFDWIGFKVVTQTVRERELARSFPLILKEEPVRVVI